MLLCAKVACEQVMDKLGLGGIIDKPYGSFMHYKVSLSHPFVQIIFHMS